MLALLQPRNKKKKKKRNKHAVQNSDTVPELSFPMRGIGPPRPLKGKSGRVNESAPTNRPSSQDSNHAYSAQPACHTAHIRAHSLPEIPLPRSAALSSVPERIESTLKARTAHEDDLIKDTQCEHERAQSTIPFVIGVPDYGENCATIIQQIISEIVARVESCNAALGGTEKAVADEEPETSEETESVKSSPRHRQQAEQSGVHEDHELQEEELLSPCLSRSSSEYFGTTSESDTVRDSIR
jgi:hypothetical protein